MTDMELRLKELAENGKITCAEALSVAREYNVSPRDVGETINSLKIKIVECQLGCFGTADRAKSC